MCSFRQINHLSCNILAFFLFQNNTTGHWVNTSGSMSNIAMKPNLHIDMIYNFLNNLQTRWGQMSSRHKGAASLCVYSFHGVNSGLRQHRGCYRVVAPGAGLIHFSPAAGGQELWRGSAGLQINEVNGCGLSLIHI